MEEDAPWRRMRSSTSTMEKPMEEEFMDMDAAFRQGSWTWRLMDMDMDFCLQSCGCPGLVLVLNGWHSATCGGHHAGAHAGRMTGDRRGPKALE